MYQIKLICLFLLVISNLSAGEYQPNDNRIDIWPKVPFVRGADLCKYKDAYSDTRSSYIDKMIKSASSVLRYGLGADEALYLLTTFNSMYERNIEVAVNNQYLDVTLESTFKAYLDQYYRNLKPRERKISFTNINDIVEAVERVKNGKQVSTSEVNELGRLDFFAIGTYSFAPNCQGEIQVTITLYGKDGFTETYQGIGLPQYVMSKIASDIFTQYQRTSFPSKIKVGNRVLNLVGGLNGSVDVVSEPRFAEEACLTLDARLPTEIEMEMLNAYGDWSGGVSLNDKVWAMPNDKVFAPYLRNPTPIREKWEVNAKEFLYYCVRD